METVAEPKSKRKAWYQEKIEALEKRIAELESKPVDAVSNFNVTPDEVRDGVHYASFAEGYVGCLHKYGLLAKEKCRIIKANLITQGPRYIGQAAWTRMKF